MSEIKSNNFVKCNSCGKIHESADQTIYVPYFIINGRKTVDKDLHFCNPNCLNSYVSKCAYYRHYLETGKKDLSNEELLNKIINQD